MPQSVCVCAKAHSHSVDLLPSITRFAPCHEGSLTLNSVSILCDSRVLEDQMMTKVLPAGRMANCSDTGSHCSRQREQTGGTSQASPMQGNKSAGRIANC